MRPLAPIALPPDWLMVRVSRLRAVLFLRPLFLNFPDTSSRLRYDDNANYSIIAVPYRRVCRATAPGIFNFQLKNASVINRSDILLREKRGEKWRVCPLFVYLWIIHTSECINLYSKVKFTHLFNIDKWCNLKIAGLVISYYQRLRKSRLFKCEVIIFF